MLKPEEVNASNVEQAKGEILAEMKRILTMTRRTSNVAEGLAQRTGRPEDRAYADKLTAQVIELDAAVSRMLEDSDERRTNGNS